LAGDEGHKVRNVLEQLLVLGMEEVELPYPPLSKTQNRAQITTINIVQVKDSF
jgi:hypothetical protein